VKVQLNTGHEIAGTEELAAAVRSVVENAANGMQDQVTRVEVHLHDENAAKGGDDDKRCMMEARIAGLDPLTVTHRAGSIDEAVDGAGHKLRRVLEGALREDPRDG
jgi:hypothetical protein